MSLLSGKKGLILGLANKDSIAWGIAQALRDEGATLAFSYAGEVLKKRVMPLVESINAPIYECDVTDDAQIESLFEQVKNDFGSLDFLIHCIAFAPREELGGRFSDTSREGFRVALDISCYSLIALAKHAREVMPQGGSMLTLTYYGAEKVMPNYNVMGVAKAALEASVRYLAWDMGKDGIRVNAISAGPIKTLASSGISGFRKSLAVVRETAPLGNVSKEDVGDTARFLVSDWSRQITGEVIYVDGGYHVMGAPEQTETAGA